MSASLPACIVLTTQEWFDECFKRKCTVFHFPPNRSPRGVSRLSNGSICLILAKPRPGAPREEWVFLGELTVKNVKLVGGEEFHVYASRAVIVEESPPPKPGESSWIIEFESLTRYRRPVKKAECDVRTSTSRKPLKDWAILGFTFIGSEDAGKVVEYVRKLAGVGVGEREVGARPSREVLEGVVARVLRDLGFSVQTNVRLPAKGGEVEVDVWAFKSVGGSQFRVYVSCKNWDRDVDRHVVDQEFGRVLQLDYMPHLRVLIVRGLTEPARKAALDDGFMVIELGRKAYAKNSREVYEIVYKAFDELFTAIAPPRLREIAEKLAEIRENLMKVKEEISRQLYM
jgi:predicted RecB family endonuclease